MKSTSFKKKNNTSFQNYFDVTLKQLRNACSIFEIRKLYLQIIVRKNYLDFYYVLCNFVFYSKM